MDGIDVAKLVEEIECLVSGGDRISQRTIQGNDNGKGVKGVIGLLGILG